MCVSFSVHDFFVGVICFLEPVVLSIIKICCWAYKKKRYVVGCLQYFRLVYIAIYLMIGAFAIFSK